MPNAIVFDCEIVHAIQGKREPRIDGIEYCGGWDDHKGMGISVCGVYDYAEDAYRVFLKDNRDEFKRLVERADLVIGFNSVGFDNKLVAACWEFEIPEAKSYDLLAEIWAAHGLGMKFVYPTHIGYGLNETAAANGLPAKTGHGGQAPIDWQQRRPGKVIDYCLNDVRVTKKLVDRVAETSKLVSPVQFQKSVEVRRPW